MSLTVLHSPSLSQQSAKPLSPVRRERPLQHQLGHLTFIKAPKDASLHPSRTKTKATQVSLVSKKSIRAEALQHSRGAPPSTGTRSVVSSIREASLWRNHQHRRQSLLLARAAPAIPSSPISEDHLSAVDPTPGIADPLSPAPSATPLSTVVAESEEERRACAAMRAQLLYPYSIPLAPAPPAFSHRDADVMSCVFNQLESRTKAEYSRDSTLKQLGLPVLSFLVLSSSDQVTEDANARQQHLMQSAHPALKSLLVCPELALPLARRSAWHQWQNTNPKHAQQQQHEMMLLHNGVGSKALGLATLDLQLPSGPGDLPLGPSESMRLRKMEQQRHSFPDKFSTWLGNGKGGLQLKEQTKIVSEEDTIRGGYIFNLCVAQLFRRQGIARRLLCHVAQYARDVQKLDCLRMHAEVSNKAAVHLYSSLGFEIEYEESEQEAALLRRPRRVLFRLNF